MIAAQVTGLSALKLHGIIRNCSIESVTYSTDIPKGGYQAEDAENVVEFDVDSDQTILHVEIGSIYQSTANVGLKMRSSAGYPTNIRACVVRRIYSTYGRVALDIDNVGEMTIEKIENNGSVTIGANCAYVTIRTGEGVSAIVDNGKYTVVNGLGKQTRGGSLPPSPNINWPIGTIIRETTNDKLYLRVAANKVAGDFIQIGSV